MKPSLDPPSLVPPCRLTFNGQHSVSLQKWNHRDCTDETCRHSVECDLCGRTLRCLAPTDCPDRIGR